MEFKDIILVGPRILSINPVDNPGFYPKPPEGCGWDRNGRMYVKPFPCLYATIKCDNQVSMMTFCGKPACEYHVWTCQCWQCLNSRGQCGVKDCKAPCTTKSYCGVETCAEHQPYPFPRQDS
jgi:hypothetical protein